MKDETIEGTVLINRATISFNFVSGHLVLIYYVVGVENKFSGPASGSEMGLSKRKTLEVAGTLAAGGRLG
jgi:hypothetical protein